MYELHVQLEFDFVSQNEAIEPERLEAEVEVTSAQLASGAESEASATIGRSFQTVGLDLERHCARHALERQVAAHGVAAADRLNPGRAERHRRMLVDVEEIRGPQVRVAARNAGVD